ncbi:MAG: Fur family transcriptional regulator [Peptococcaceae bacterium]
MELNDLLDILKSHGYKITEQRKTILQVLAAHNQNLIPVEILLNKSKEIYPKTNMSTVYRNLEILEKLNLIYKVNTENNTTLYKLICSAEHHHHHLICKQCGKTEAIDFCPINTLKKLSRDKNFNLTDHKIELYGYCRDCEAAKNN